MLNEVETLREAIVLKRFKTLATLKKHNVRYSAQFSDKNASWNAFEVQGKSESF